MYVVDQFTVSIRLILSCNADKRGVPTRGKCYKTERMIGNHHLSVDILSRLLVYVTRQCNNSHTTHNREGLQCCLFGSKEKVLDSRIGTIRTD